MQKVRILHMIGSLNMGGSQTMVMNLYRNIDRTKVQFDFIVDHPDELYFENEIKQLGGKIYFMPTFTGKNIFSIIKEWNNFFKEHQNYKIFHSHVRSYASIYLPIAHKYGLKTIIHSHNTSSGSGLSAVVKKVLQYPLRYQADYYFACSLLAGKWLFGESVINQDNFFILKNAVDSRKFSYSEENRKIIRNEFNIDDTCLVVGHVGRFHSQKNHSYLVDIFSEIHAKENNSVLLLVGDGELKNEVMKKVNSMHLTEKVIFAGVRSDISALLSAMDVFVFPSVFEGLPVVLIEAQASGLPCILSDTVTREVDIGVGLVSFISLESNIVKWAEKVQDSMIIQRKDTFSSIQSAGYDITGNAELLENFYLKLVKKYDKEG